MDEKQAAIVALNSMLQSCVDNSADPVDDNDAFMRGFAAAHRKMAAFIPHIIEYLADGE